MSQDAKAMAAQRNDASTCREAAAGTVSTADRRFVDREEFYRLAISSRQLLRCDDVEAGLRGLWDPQSGVRFMIEEEKLYARPSAVRGAAKGDSPVSFGV